MDSDRKSHLSVTVILCCRHAANRRCAQGVDFISTMRLAISAETSAFSVTTCIEIGKSHPLFNVRKNTVYLQSMAPAGSDPQVALFHLQLSIRRKSHTLMHATEIPIHLFFSRSVWVVLLTDCNALKLQYWQEHGMAPAGRGTSKHYLTCLMFKLEPRTTGVRNESTLLSKL